MLRSLFCTIMFYSVCTSSCASVPENISESSGVPFSDLANIEAQHGKIIKSKGFLGYELDDPDVAYITDAPYDGNLSRYIIGGEIDRADNYTKSYFDSLKRDVEDESVAFSGLMISPPDCPSLIGAAFVALEQGDSHANLPSYCIGDWRKIKHFRIVDQAKMVN